MKMRKSGAPSQLVLLAIQAASINSMESRRSPASEGFCHRALGV